MLKKFTTLSYLFVLVGLLQSGCKDFIEPSLEGRQVVLLAPADSTETSKYQMGFWWEPVADALYYRLQIVSPDFVSTSSLIKDTLIERKTDYMLTLEPGKYAWRVRAENGSSVSGYSVGSFVVHESSLAEQKVTLTAPGNNYLSNLSSLTLSWDRLFGADSYLLQIDTLSFSDETDLVFNGTVATGNYVFNFPKEGTYQWRIRAQSAVDSSRWSDVRIMTYDKTAPGKVTPVSPAKGATVALPVTISWTAVATARRYKLYVFKGDGITAYNSSFPIRLTGTSYVFEGEEPGERIFWRVSALDEAGNEGVLSDEMDFSTQ